MSGHIVKLFINDPELVEDAFVKNNKYLTKCSFVRNLMYPLMGESILLADSSEQWSNKRKVLSASFYKDKLLKMIDLSLKMINSSITEWEEKFID